jgi:alpha-1,2-mannosyltransferase
LLLAATTLSSPHILDYDLMLLAPALAFFVAARADTHFRDYEISLLAAVWLAPLLARTIASLTAIPIGALANVILFLLIVREPVAVAANFHRRSDHMAGTLQNAANNE